MLERGAEAEWLEGFFCMEFTALAMRCLNETANGSSQFVARNHVNQTMMRTSDIVLNAPTYETLQRTISF